MIAVKGFYNNGVITLLEPLPQNITKAELNILVLPELGQKKVEVPAKAFCQGKLESEDDFKALGMASFLNQEDDANVDWEDCFGLK